MSDMHILLKEYSAGICDIFEDLLEKHDITIPSEDRDGHEGEARLYGTEYGELEDEVFDMLVTMMNEVHNLLMGELVV